MGIIKGHDTFFSGKWPSYAVADKHVLAKCGIIVSAEYGEMHHQQLASCFYDKFEEGTVLQASAAIIKRGGQEALHKNLAALSSLLVYVNSTLDEPLASTPFKGLMMQLLIHVENLWFSPWRLRGTPISTFAIPEGTERRSCAAAAAAYYASVTYPEHLVHAFEYAADMRSLPRLPACLTCGRGTDNWCNNCEVFGNHTCDNLITGFCTVCEDSCATCNICGYSGTVKFM